MEDTFGGRGRREKIPSAKVKEQSGSRNDKSDDDKTITLPTYVAANDPKFLLEQREIAKTYDHTKILPNGSKVDFYTLSGTHVESKDRRYYIRAKRDPNTFYFHACEVPPLYARFSDENHQQCVADKTESCFTKNMLGKTGEFGNYTTRANVAVREGEFCWEARIISASDKGNEDPRISLAEMQSRDHSRTDRGGIRVGFVRREHSWSENLGTNAYSYAFTARGSGTAEYGNVRFNSEMFKVRGMNPGNLGVGDVIGLKITLPPLQVHKKVADGTFSAAEYPHLYSGPISGRSKKQPLVKKATKTTSAKSKESETGPKKDTKKTASASFYAGLAPLVSDPDLPPALDILRDRNPFLHRGMVYFECPDYTNRPDLLRPMTRGKTVNPDTGKPYQIDEEAHPNHDLAHLRTLPGSKIEVWVNGKYQGIVWDNLLAFLSPASFIEKSNKTTNLWGEVDDGQLGYYPAVSTFTGGAVECKFDGPWHYGFDDYPPTTEYGQSHDVRAVGDRYAEQIVEDFVCDLVDEVCLEATWRDDKYMRKQITSSSAPGQPVLTPAPSMATNSLGAVHRQSASSMHIQARATNTGHRPRNDRLDGAGMSASEEAETVAHPAPSDAVEASPDPDDSRTAEFVT